MALKVKMIQQTEIKASGDVFHELFGNNPHQIPAISSGRVLGCNLHDGEFGKKDSIISWNYYHDGKIRTAKERVEVIDEENKIVVFKVLEGDLLELYKSFVLTTHVETKGGSDLVTVTFDYEKHSPDVEEPTGLMDYMVAVVKDIEAHHLK